MNRRGFVKCAMGAGVLGLSGCAAQEHKALRPVPAPTLQETPEPPREAVALYAALPHEKFPIPAVDIAEVPERFWRRRVPYPSTHARGTLIVDTASFHLYLIESANSAMRYGVSLGKAGFAWSGRGIIQWKREWPTWTPPDTMIARNPELERWSVRNGGMPPGLQNPLGARALYIFQNGEDTLYRVHGTPDNDSIGRAVSHGCVRMINQDVIDLHARVRPGGEIIVA